MARETALLAIDVQKGLFHSKNPPWAAPEILRRIDRCGGAFRSAGAVVVMVQHDGASEEATAPDSDGWQLAPEIETHPDDVRIRKTTCDAFYQTSLDQQLRHRGIKNLVITGYATEFCIEATVRMAVSRDYQVLVARDAHTTNDNPVLKAGQIIEHHNRTWPECAAVRPVKVASADELIRAIQGSAPTGP